eukprot:scaffold24258_cov47-Attheya_sp.AAC.5
MATTMLERTITPYCLRLSSGRGDPYRMRICLKMVDLPDSPAPNSSSFTLDSSSFLAISSSRSMAFDAFISITDIPFDAPPPAAASGVDGPHPIFLIEC